MTAKWRRYTWRDSGEVEYRLRIPGCDARATVDQISAPRWRWVASVGGHEGPTFYGYSRTLDAAKTAAERALRRLVGREWRLADKRLKAVAKAGVGK